MENELFEKIKSVKSIYDARAPGRARHGGIADL